MKHGGPIGWDDVHMDDSSNINPPNGAFSHPCIHYDNVTGIISSRCNPPTVRTDTPPTTFTPFTSGQTFPGSTEFNFRNQRALEKNYSNLAEERYRKDGDATWLVYEDQMVREELRREHVSLPIKNIRIKDIDGVLDPKTGVLVLNRGQIEFTNLIGQLHDNASELAREKMARLIELNKLVEKEIAEQRKNETMERLDGLRKF